MHEGESLLFTYSRAATAEICTCRYVAVGHKHVDLVSDEHAAEAVHFVVWHWRFVSEVVPPLSQCLQCLRLVHVEHEQHGICSAKECRRQTGESFLARSVLKEYSQWKDNSAGQLPPGLSICATPIPVAFPNPRRSRSTLDVLCPS